MKTFKISLIVEKTETGEYWGYSPDLPGLHVLADSEADVVELAPEIARDLVEAMRDKKVPPPEKFADYDGSQKFQVELYKPAHEISRSRKAAA